MGSSSPLEEELRLRRLYQAVLARFLHYSSGQHPIDEVIREALRIVGEATGSSRSYIFQMDDTHRLMVNTHEWVAAGVESFVGLEASYDDFPYWVAELEADRPIVGGDIRADLPGEVHEVLSMQGILSILVVPLVIDGRLWGFMGLDECVAQRRWNPLETDLLRTYAQTVTLAVHRLTGRPEDVPVIQTGSVRTRLLDPAVREPQ